MAENPGDLVAVGEIQNVGSNVIGTAYVAGHAYNSTGGVLDSQETLAYFQDLLPGQKAPFYIDFLPESSPTQDQTWVPSVTSVAVEATYVSDTNAAQYSGLTIPKGSTTSSVDSTGTYTVTGTVKNTGNETASNVYVDATFYNSSGSVISLYITNYLSSSLAPSASVTFTATPTDNTAKLSNEITNYSFLIQSTPVTPTATPTLSPASSSPTPISSASTQPTQSPAQIPLGPIFALAGAVVVIVVVLAVLMLLSKRRKNAQFETPPPPPPPPPPP
jgi:hypothetical protein